MFMPTSRRDGQAGIMLMELMVSVAIMGVLVLGLTTVLVEQARQVSNDKLLNDMYTYAEMVMDEAADSFGAAYEVDRNAISGATVRQDLEFNLLGTTNMGRKLESRFTLEGERKVVVRHNGQRPSWVEGFPPPQLDPDRHMNLRHRIRIKEFSVTSYQDRLFVNPRISSILSEITLVLELEDTEHDYKIQREFRRIVSTPNKHITEMRSTQTGQDV
jgi:hypothetical protein